MSKVDEVITKHGILVSSGAFGDSVEPQLAEVLPRVQHVPDSAQLHCTLPQLS